MKTTTKIRAAKKNAAPMSAETLEWRAKFYANDGLSIESYMRLGEGMRRAGVPLI